MPIRLLSGDCRDVLPTLAAESVHCVVTSPPYYGLRSYLDASHVDKPREIGSEATPEDWLAVMVGVFRKVRRVLRRDGTCWVNVGDSYATQPCRDQGMTNKRPFDGGAYRRHVGMSTAKHGKPKDLLLMPARLALALQADGWWVRSDIIWAKPNPMPESCTDRPTSSYEHVFLLTKSARYFYDADAVREPCDEPWRSTGRIEQRGSKDVTGGINGGFGLDGLRPRLYNPAGRSCRNVWTIATAPFAAAHFATYPPELVERCIRAGTSERGCCAVCGAPWVREVLRNLDNVPTRTATRYIPADREARGAYLRERREALGLPQKDVAEHFPSATGALTGCVANWELGYNTPTLEQWAKLKEVLGLDDRFDERVFNTVEVRVTDHSPAKAAGVRTYAKAWNAETTTTGWRAGCGCNAETVPCTVLDPFSGSGTTLLVADRLLRDAIGIDLSATYADMARNRIEADCPLFTSWSPAEPPEDTRMADLFSYAAD